MQIGHLEKFSTIDYPDKLSCVIFLKGCNFHCGFCYNKQMVIQDLIKQSPNISEKEILDFLDTRIGKLEAVVISGGEPSIYSDELIDFIKKIKEKGFLVKLDCNGSNTQIIKKIIDDNLIDYIAMDIKQIFEKYNLFTKIDSNVIKETFELIKNSNIKHEFRITIHPQLTIDDFNKIIKLLDNQLVYIQKFMNINTIEDYKDSNTIYNQIDRNDKRYIFRE